MHVATISLEYQVSPPPDSMHDTVNFNYYNPGVAVACAIKAALEKHNLSGKIVLLGTPGKRIFSAIMTMAFQLIFR